ncbi:MAG TPA: radical SAM protein [Dehalococcoidia bacterium]|nr:radical SAM protein [Dehalococcoidia bacterium]
MQPDERILPGLNFGGLMVLEPMALELLAGSIPEHTVKIIDMRMAKSPLSYYLSEFKPDVVGVTGVTALHNSMQNIITRSKAYGAFTVAGGCHASFAYRQFYDLDVVVVGEGEGSFRMLISALETNSSLEEVPNLQIHKDNEWVPTKHVALDEWPLPRRDLVEGNKYTLFGKDFLVMEATRGCPHRCKFCVTPHLFKGRYRVRPVEQVVDYIASKLQPIILFPDSDFLASSKYAWSLLEAIKRSGLRKKYMIMVRSDEITAEPELIREWGKAGLLSVFIGYEGIDQIQLNKFNKDNLISNNEQAVSILDECGVISIGTLIVDPSWEVEDFRKARAYSRKLESDVTLFSILTPFPGTDIFPEYEIIEDYHNFDVIHPVVKTFLPPTQFQREFLKLAKATISDHSFKLGRKLVKHGLLNVIPKVVFGLAQYIRKMGNTEGYKTHE